MKIKLVAPHEHGADALSSPFPFRERVLNIVKTLSFDLMLSPLWRVRRVRALADSLCFVSIIKRRHKVMKALIRLFMLMPAIIIVGCAHHHGVIYGPMQPDGWSAQPISINCRFAPYADLDPVTERPWGTRDITSIF